MHPDGTIFAALYDRDAYEDGNPAYSVIGIDPTTGAQKFRAQTSVQSPGAVLGTRGLIIAGDGYAYMPYIYAFCDDQYHLALLRVNSSGASDNIHILDWKGGDMCGDGIGPPPVSMITNADQGILLTMAGAGLQNGVIAITTGTGVSLIAAPGAFEGGPIAPVLQAQDGSFVGTASDFWTGDQYMASFDQTGAIRWMVPGNYQPQIATADGGLIATDPSGAAITFDQYGNATGALPGSPVQSWMKQTYTSGGGGVSDVVLRTAELATGYQSQAGGNPSSNGTSVGIAEPVEGVPVFLLDSWVPYCEPPANGGAKVPLSGAALAQYDSLKLELLSGGSLTSNSCQQLQGADPSWATYFAQLLIAVTRQIPWDGPLSSISQFDAGMSSGKNPVDVRIKKVLPVCALFVPFHGPYGLKPPSPGPAIAASQIVPPAGSPATDIYINTDPTFLNFLSQGTILHETLHNLTGVEDFVDTEWRQLYGYTPPYDLKSVVGIEKTPGVDPDPKGFTHDITIQLEKNGCAPAN